MSLEHHVLWLLQARLWEIVPTTLRTRDEIEIRDLIGHRNDSRFEGLSFRGNGEEVGGPGLDRLDPVITERVRATHLDSSVIGNINDRTHDGPPIRIEYPSRDIYGRRGWDQHRSE